MEPFHELTLPWETLDGWYLLTMSKPGECLHPDLTIHPYTGSIDENIEGRFLSEFLAREARDAYYAMYKTQAVIKPYGTAKAIGAPKS